MSHLLPSLRTHSVVAMHEENLNTQLNDRRIPPSLAATIEACLASVSEHLQHARDLEARALDPANAGESETSDVLVRGADSIVKTQVEEQLLALDILLGTC
jgi:hypothetical protein